MLLTHALVVILIFNQCMSLTVYSPSLGGPVLLYKPQVASHPESTSITDSEGSNDHLLQPSPPAPVESSHLLYAQVDPVKQTQVPPPANDDPVQYTLIKHQDKL